MGQLLKKKQKQKAVLLPKKRLINEYVLVIPVKEISKLKGLPISTLADPWGNSVYQMNPEEFKGFLKRNYLTTSKNEVKGYGVILTYLLRGINCVGNVFNSWDHFHESNEKFQEVH
jgi:hypothetical protein